MWCVCAFCCVCVAPVALCGAPMSECAPVVCVRGVRGCCVGVCRSCLSYWLGRQYRTTTPWTQQQTTGTYAGSLSPLLPSKQCIIGYDMYHRKNPVHLHTFTAWRVLEILCFCFVADTYMTSLNGNTNMLTIRSWVMFVCAIRVCWG